MSTLARNRDFRLLFAAQTTSLVGSGVTSVALAAFAYDLAGGNAAIVVGTALTLRILAFVTLAPIAGVVADRVDRKRLMVVTDVVRVALLGAFPFVTTVGQVYALIFAINAATAFFTPAFEAALPDVVGAEHYTRAVSWSRIAVALETTLGPLFAGILISLVGVRWTFWADGATYLLSAGLLLFAHVPAVRETGRTAGTRFLADLTHGSRLLLREPSLRKALLLHMAEAIAGAAAIVTTIVYVRDVLGRGDVAFSLTMAGFGLGAAMVALVLPARAERARASSDQPGARHLHYHAWAERTLLIGGVMLAIALLPGILRPGIFLLGFLWMLNGAGQTLVAIPSVGLLAEHTRAEERGRAYAAHFAWTHLFWLGTYPASAYLSDRLGTPAAFTLLGIACALLTLAATFVRSGPHQHGRAQADPSPGN